MEVAPLVSALLLGIWDAERDAAGHLRLIDIPGPRVRYSRRAIPALVDQVSGLTALEAGEHVVHFKRTVAGALVGPVTVDGLLRVLLQPWPHLPPEGGVQAVFVLAYLLKEGLVYEFVSWIPRDVAPERASLLSSITITYTFAELFFQIGIYISGALEI